MGVKARLALGVTATSMTPVESAASLKAGDRPFIVRAISADVIVLTMIEISPSRALFGLFWRPSMIAMRNIGYAAALAVLIVGAAPRSISGAQANAPAAGATVYLRALEDIPLMAGLAERSYSGITFETPTGRIVEAVAWSPPAMGLTPNRVTAFYHATLVALGWKVLGGGSFAREEEILRISTSLGAKGLEVRFSLRPK